MRDSLVAALVLVPFVAATVVLAVVTVGERAGGTPFSDGGPRNGAEAAALGDAAAVVRSLQRGDDPERVRPVRPEVISSSVLQVSMIEAAVWSRRIEMVQLIDRVHGESAPRSRHELGCLAADLQQPDVAEYLEPDGADCAPGEAVTRVLARSIGRR